MISVSFRAAFPQPTLDTLVLVHHPSLTLAKARVSGRTVLQILSGPRLQT
jgi:hypothetical protein